MLLHLGPYAFITFRPSTDRCNVIEDEVHFKTLISNITHLPINGLINELTKSSNYFVNIQFIKYISACFDVRDKLLSK